MLVPCIQGLVASRHEILPCLIRVAYISLEVPLGRLESQSTCQCYSDIFILVLPIAFIPKVPIREASAQMSSPAKFFGTPFEDEDADVILRTSDLVDFRTHKLLLKKASPIFADMFTLPQPPVTPGGSAQDIDELRDGLHVIPISEDSETLHALLSIVSHAGPLLPPATFEKAAAVLVAAKKYEMDGVLFVVRAVMPKNLINADNALRAYGVARDYHLRDEAMTAARYTLEKPMSIEQYGQELRFVTGTALYDLAQFRTKCRNAVSDRLMNIQMSGRMFSAVFSTSGRCTNGGWSREAIGGALKWIPQWWRDYLQQTINGLLAGRIMPTTEAAVNPWAFYTGLSAHNRQGICACCDGISAEDSQRFCALLKKELESAIEAVQTDITD